MIRSSYIENDYGAVFYRMICTYKPSLAVELGVLDGYSTLHIAKGLKHNKEFYGFNGYLNSYDLWDDYSYNHGKKEQVQKLLDENEVSEFVTLHKGDAFEVHKDFKNESIEFLHVDISNDGERIKKIFEHWCTKVMTQRFIAIEGGSVERDNVEWMVKYNKPSLRKELYKNKTFNHYFWFGTYPKFPSLTVAYKKRGD